MSTSHAWINACNIGRFQFFIGGTDFCQFYIDRFFLLCFRKIVFPSESFCGCFFICTWIYCPQMFYPDSSNRVFHHITHNPIRCKELSGCWNSFFRDLYILFQFCEGIIFQFCIVILIQPANDFYLSGWIAFFVQCRYIKILFWNTSLWIHKHIDDIIFIGVRNTKEQFHIVRVRLKQSWQDIM